MIYDLKELGVQFDEAVDQADAVRTSGRVLIAIAELLQAFTETQKAPQDKLFEFSNDEGECFSIRESMIYEIKRDRYARRTILETHLGQRLVRGDYTEIRNQIWGDR